MINTQPGRTWNAEPADSAETVVRDHFTSTHGGAEVHCADQLLPDRQPPGYPDLLIAVSYCDGKAETRPRPRPFVKKQETRDSCGMIAARNPLRCFVNQANDMRGTRHGTEDSDAVYRRHRRRRR